MTELTDASAIAYFLAKYPKGFSVDPAGLLTAREGVRITGGQQLAEVARKPKILNVPIGGEVVEIEVVVLSDKQTEAINRLVPSPTAPAKFKTEAGGKKVPDGYDTMDPKFREQVEQVYVLRRALGIATGIPSLAVPGNSAEEKHAWLQENFATNLLETLYAGVRALSVDPLERASFLSGSV